MGRYLGGMELELLTWVVVTTINRLRILLFLAETGPRVRSIPHLKIAYMGLLRAYVGLVWPTSTAHSTTVSPPEVICQLAPFSGCQESSDLAGRDHSGRGWLAQVPRCS